MESKKSTTNLFKSSLSKSAKIEELDIFRAVAILAVIMIHITANPIVQLPVHSFFYPIYLSANVLSRFTVPSFIFLSGLVLFYRYASTWTMNQSWNFYKKRFVFLLVPYFFWTVFYYAARLIYSGQPLSALNLKTLAYFLLLGKAYSHLYFIVIIIQFYLLMPLFLQLSRRLWRRQWMLVIVGLLLQWGFYWVNREWLHWDLLKSRLFFTYSAYFLIGAWIGMNYSAAAVWARRYWMGIMLVTLTTGFLHVLFFYLPVLQWPTVKGYWFELVWFFYTLGICLLLIVWGQKMINRGGKLVKGMISIGVYSFAIYFIHMFIIMVWKKWLYTSAPVWYHLSYAGDFLAALFVSYALIRFIRMFPIYPYLFGR